MRGARRWRNLAVIGGAAGVGKTVVTTALLRYLYTNGSNPQPLKALAVWDGQGTHPADLLRQAGGVNLSRRKVNPHSVELVAPLRGFLTIADARREVALHDADAVDLTTLTGAELALCRQTVASTIEELALVGPIVIEGAGAFGACEPSYDLANVLAPQLADAIIVLVVDARRADLEQQIGATLQRAAEQGLDVGVVAYNRSSRDSPPGIFPGLELTLSVGDGYLAGLREGSLTLDRLWDERAAELASQRDFDALLLEMRTDDCRPA